MDTASRISTRSMSASSGKSGEDREGNGSERNLIGTGTETNGDSGVGGEEAGNSGGGVKTLGIWVGGVKTLGIWVEKPAVRRLGTLV